jgi:hypothetical protein
MPMAQPIRPAVSPSPGMGSGGMAPRPATPMGGGAPAPAAPRPATPGAASPSPQPYRPSWARDDDDM